MLSNRGPKREAGGSFLPERSMIELVPDSNYRPVKSGAKFKKHVKGGRPSERDKRLRDRYNGRKQHINMLVNMAGLTINDMRYFVHEHITTILEEWYTNTKEIPEGVRTRIAQILNLPEKDVFDPTGAE